MRWCWLVDPKVQTFEILERNERGAYTIVVSASTGTVQVPGCDGLVIELDALWAEVADLDA